MSTKIPAPGTRVMGLLLSAKGATCLSFGTVTGHRQKQGSRAVEGFNVRHDSGEENSYSMSSHGDYWELVSDHRASAADVQPVRGDRWKSRFGDYPARATVAEAVEDSRAWWEAKAEPRKP